MIPEEGRSSSGVAGSKDETSVSDKLYGHSDHVLIRKKPQQSRGNVTVPAVSYAAVILTNTAPEFFLALKESSMFWVNKTT